MLSLNLRDVYVGLGRARETCLRHAGYPLLSATLEWVDRVPDRDAPNTHLLARVRISISLFFDNYF
jgi:hypothetical protein